MQHFDVELHLIKRKKESLEDLAGQSARGDERARRKLYDQLSPRMYPVCLRYMGSRDDAEDVLQEGFVTLFSRLDSYSGTGSFEGWARRIFVNTALMRLRKNDALKDSDDIDVAWNICSEDVSAIGNIGYKELLKLIGELPVGFRTVFNMYVIEGYSHKEIADTLGISENTSRSQLQRARTMLQKKILRTL